MQPTIELNSSEFFEFLGRYDKYPTSGFQLAEAAREARASSELVSFFEGVPGQFANMAEILPYAEDISKPPVGMALETVVYNSDASGQAAARHRPVPTNDTTLNLQDIVPRRPG
ncbi:MAG TPA: hypothetical protein VI322_03490 [Candidatus Saccharimonadia bacterium]